MTNMGMASVRKVHPHLLYARHELILMGASP